MHAIALHGDGGTPEMLRRDMGDPTWVTEYFNGRKWKYIDESIEKLASTIIKRATKVALVGYSRGGMVATQLSLMPQVSRYIACGVLYEAPPNKNGCSRLFPVLHVWNDRGAIRRLHRVDDVVESIRMWTIDEPCSMLIGSGNHMSVNPPGHEWDKSLNSRIEAWIQKHAA
jgi:pimeloyl-ACP methyl ester carboxylesterase